MFPSKLVEEMRLQAKVISPQISPALTKTFGNYEVFSVEERLFEPIHDFDKEAIKLKGFIVSICYSLIFAKYILINFAKSSESIDSIPRLDSFSRN